MYGVVFRGRRYDTGDKLSYLKACVQLACDSEDLGPRPAGMAARVRRQPRTQPDQVTPVGGSFNWPATLECGDLVLRPIRYRDRKEWTEVRSRNSEWLAPWEASNPAPGGGLPDYRQMVRSLKAQAAQGTALPFLITAWTPGFRRACDRGPTDGVLDRVGIGDDGHPRLLGGQGPGRAGYRPDGGGAGNGLLLPDLGLHRMEINIRPENGPSLRVVEKLGFRDEGYRPRFLHINGQWADHRTFALTSEEVPEGLLARWQRNRHA